MKIKVFVMIMALVLLFVSCEDMFETMGRWNLNDPLYDKEGNPIDQPDQPPIAPSNLAVSFFLENNNFNLPRVRLQWQNNSSYTQKTIIERAKEGTGDFVLLAEVPYVMDAEGHDNASLQFVDDTLNKDDLSECGYMYRVKAANPRGASAVDEKMFYCPPVIVDFFAVGNTTGSTYGNQDEKFTFSYEIYGLVDTVTWNYGDESTAVLASTDEAPQKQYALNGLFNVSLSATGPGNPDKAVSLTKDNFISINIPRAGFRIFADINPAISGYETEIVDTIIMNPGEQIEIVNEAVFAENIMWSVNFKGSNELITLNNQTSTNYYTIPEETEYGRFEISQIAIGADLDAKVVRKSINVGRGELTLSCTGMDVNNRSITISQERTILFDNTCSGFEPIRLTINYGDGITENVPTDFRSIPHQYVNPGSYTCTLILRTAFYPNEAEISKSIQVNVLGRKLISLPNGISYSTPGDLRSGDMDGDNDTDFMFINGTGTNRSLMWIDVSSGASMAVDYLRTSGSANVLSGAEILQAELVDVGEANLYLIVSVKTTTGIDIRIFKSEGKFWSEVADSAISIVAETACFAVGSIDNTVPDLAIYSSHTDSTGETPVTTNSLTCYSGDATGTPGEPFVFSKSGTVLETISPAGAIKIIVANLSEKQNDEILLLANGTTGKTVYFYEKPGTDGIFTRYDLSIGNGHLIEIGDVDGDSDLDLIVHTGTADGGNLFFYRNQAASQDGAASFSSNNMNYTYSVNTLAVLDVDSDNLSEVVTGSIRTYLMLRNFEGNSFTNAGDPFFKYPDNSGFHYFNSIAMGDIDGDGKSDLLVSEAEGIFWYPNIMIK
ncbi:MAG: VCBS repeat-containing protein [Spirochaetales bacterium]|nr:VCBS repeat-containing protein [Spirochaetales bacterium]